MFIVPIGFYLAWLAYYIILTIVLCGDYIKRNNMVTMQANFTSDFWQKTVCDNTFRKMWIIRKLGLETDEHRELCWIGTFCTGHIVYNVCAMFISWVNYRFFYAALVINSIWIMRAFYNGANYYMTRFSVQYEEQLRKLSELEKTLSV